MLEQLLFPPRLVARAFDDLHRAADAIERMAAAAIVVEDEVANIRALIEPMRGELDALRREFGGANDEIERLRNAFSPELAAIRDASKVMAAEVAGLHATTRRLARDADEVREVVEPLQTATERVGRVAEKLPGPGRKR